MSERRIYKTPPIAEAVCEICYTSDDWDPTIPGRMQERLGTRYNGKPQEQRILHTDMRPVDTPNSVGVEIQEQQQNRIQLRDISKTRVLSIAENILSVSDLAPYSGWEDFYSRIEEAVRTYNDLASPLGVTRIGIRYINRVQVSADVSNLEDYFRIRAQLPPNPGATMHTLISRSESRYDDGPGLTVTFASSESTPSESIFVLDLDVWAEPGLETDLELTLAVVVDLRNREREAFENSITDKARNLFNGNT